MPKFCVYCGNPIKASDKFCISCGKPLLTGSSNSKKKEEKKPEKEKLPVKKEEPEDIKEAEEDVIEEEPKKEEKVKKEKKEIYKEPEPLPEEVKHQLDLYIESTEIEFQKKILTTKLNEVLKATKAPQYETDFDFKQNTNVKLEAIKTLITDLKDKEIKIKSQMDDVFIVKKLNSLIETKEFQLKNLTREFRLKKMNKETFERLKDKYKGEKISAESERTELMMGIKLWIQELKTERTELIGEQKLNKGRLSSKEISKEVYKSSDEDYKLKIEKMAKKIETLQGLIKK